MRVLSSLLESCKYIDSTKMLHGCAGSSRLPLQGLALIMEGQCQGVYHNNRAWWPFPADCTVLTGGEAPYSSANKRIC